ncbi:hypothetical protein TrVFT333_004787 [Trichoderma virens FT-333]|nr:hypothetical protein TrVFT333_004787 [Trichoderma virens FT-333]
MQLNVIDFQQVLQDLDKGVPINFNTNFHTAADAPDLPIPSNKPDAEVGYVYFLPFNAGMKSAREYRVFCVPNSLDIAAVSQYEWHKQWIFANEDRDVMTRAAQRIFRGIQKVHAEIIAFMHAHEDNSLENFIRSQGFTFDVLYDEVTGQCMLIELNTFGVRSACGSCLFQWLKDRAVLYGETGDVEFRVAM